VYGVLNVTSAKVYEAVRKAVLFEKARYLSRSRPLAASYSKCMRRKDYVCIL
jgi:hypothetical protein